VDNQVTAFVAEARRYCALIDGENASDSSVFEVECLTLLLRLYQQILLLPNAESSAGGLFERISYEEWKAVRKRTAERIDYDLYWEVFEPFAETKPDPTCGSISDDLADIWQDLKVGLLTFDSGQLNCVKDAVWHWRFSFGSHWGYHLAGAIRALTTQRASQFY
jgi:hypothetical protein